MSDGPYSNPTEGAAGTPGGPPSDKGGAGSGTTRDTDIFLYVRKLKRSLIFWRLLTVAAVIALIVGLADTPVLDQVDNGKDRIARLEVSDIILTDRYRLAALDRALKNSHVKALVVKVNSPGGSFVGGESLHRKLKEFQKEKPVVVVMEDLATSAGYMIALPADRVFASPGTLTGSIGVLLQMVEFTQLMDAVGIEPVIIKSAPLKATPNPFEQTTDEARAAIQGVINDSYDMFVDMVVEGREISRDQVLPLADGRVYTGRQALEAGLIDALGGEQEAIQWLVENKDIDPALDAVDLTIDYPEKGWDEWLETATSALSRMNFSQNSGLISMWRP